MKKITAVLLALMLVFALCACGGDDPNAGTYYLTSAEISGITLSAEDLSSAMGEDAGAYYIELKGNGTFTGDTGAGLGSGEWSLDGTELTITESGYEMYGTLENGVLTLYEPNSGVTFYFEK